MVHQSEDKTPIKTNTGAEGTSPDACASVNAGVCGFTCRIRAWKIDKSAVGLTIKPIHQFGIGAAVLDAVDIQPPISIKVDERRTRTDTAWHKKLLFVLARNVLEVDSQF